MPQNAYLSWPLSTCPPLAPFGCSATDPYLPLIRSKLEASQDKVKSKPLLRVLRAAGCMASLRVLQRALKELRQEWSRDHRRTYRAWVSAPGEFLIVDWGEVGTVTTAAGQRKLLCFCAVLGWSRWKYVRFFTGQRFPILAQGLAGCFESLGGVPASVLFDNPKRSPSASRRVRRCSTPNWCAWRRVDFGAR